MAKAKKAKKAASKLKRKKLKAVKPAARKKATRKVAKRKVSTRPAPKRAPKPAPKPASKPVTPQPSPAPEAPPGDRVGVVTHYFGHLSVAVVKLDPNTILRVGDRIHVKGHTSDFSQRVESLQIGHAAVEEVGPDDDFGLKVVDHAREHDVVYRVK
jgi:putative protease